MNDATVTVEQLLSVLDRAVTDPAFRAALRAHPADTLRDAGITLPAGSEIQVVENTAQIRHILVAAAPGEGVAPADASALTAEGPIAAYAQLLAESWTNASLRASLLADPGATLAAHGVALPDGVEAKAIESSDRSLVLALPPPATSGEPTSLGEMAEQITSSYSNLTKLITAGSYLAGLGFSIGAIMKFKQHKDNPTQIPIGTPRALEFIAAALLFFPRSRG